MEYMIGKPLPEITASSLRRRYITKKALHGTPFCLKSLLELAEPILSVSPTTQHRGLLPPDENDPEAIQGFIEAGMQDMETMRS